MKSSWTLLTINDVCSVTDCQHKTAPTVDIPTEYRMLRTANIRNGQLRDVNDTKSVTKDTYDKWSVRGYLDSGDVILTREAPMGEVVLLRENEKYKYFLGQRMLQLKAYKDVITPEFLYYSLQTRELQHQIMMNEGTGSVVSNIRIPLLKKMKLFVPNLQEQQRITKSLFDIDNKIIVNKEIIDNLERLSQTLFKHWFIDFEFPNEQGQSYKSNGGEMVKSELGSIPSGWAVSTIDKVGTVVGGGTPSKKYEEYYTSKGISWITPKDLSCNKSLYIYKGAIDITELGLKKGSAKILPKNTVLFSSRAPIGYIAIAGQEVTTNQGFKSIIPNNGYSQYYIYHLLHQKLPSIEAAAGGSTFKEISGKGLKEISIILPPLKVTQEFKDIVEPIFLEIQILEMENKKLKELRDSLFPKLLSGEIEI